MLKAFDALMGEKYTGREHPILVFMRRLGNMYRKRVFNCCVYALSNEKCRGREHPYVVFMYFRMKSAEEESTHMLYLCVFK